MANPLLELQALGQSIWLDFISRQLITTGQLKRMIDEDGLRGMTSNPTIFQNEIVQSNVYDDAIRVILKAQPRIAVEDLYDRLTIETIQMACDVMRSIYDTTDGFDGMVSLEPSGRQAYDTQTTIADVRRLWKTVDRPNVMIKVPAPPPSIPAIEAVIAEGVNINITLMFSMAHYEAVASAYLKGIMRSPNPRHQVSVASFFISRIETAVDKQPESLGPPDALAIRGKAAIASATVVYRRFRELFHGDRFAAAKSRGARVQRPLWGSTSTKNPSFPDTIYVDNLIGPETINTLPMPTLDAFRDHGKARVTLTEGVQEADEVLAKLAKLGIDLSAVTEKLQVDGVAAFVDSYEKSLDALRKRMK